MEILFVLLSIGFTQLIVGIAVIFGIYYYRKNVRSKTKKPDTFRFGLIMAIIGIVMVVLSQTAKLEGTSEQQNSLLFIGIIIALVGAVMSVNKYNKPEEK